MQIQFKAGLPDVFLKLKRSFPEEMGGKGNLRQGRGLDEHELNTSVYSKKENLN